MALFFVFWFYASSLPLLYVLEFLKINQFCLVALFFYGFMATVLDRPTLVEVLLWPIHGLVVILLVGLLGYGLWASQAPAAYPAACETPAWLAMSALGAGLGLAFLAVAAHLHCRVRACGRAGPGGRPAPSPRPARGCTAGRRRAPAARAPRHQAESCRRARARVLCRPGPGGRLPPPPRLKGGRQMGGFARGPSSPLLFLERNRPPPRPPGSLPTTWCSRRRTAPTTPRWAPGRLRPAPAA